jgi:hypothetical protein
VDLVPESPYRFRIDRHGDMRVPGVVFASRALIPDVRGDKSLEQVVNVATLPGIVTASYALHQRHHRLGEAALPGGRPGFYPDVRGVRQTPPAHGATVSWLSADHPDPRGA